MEQKTKLKELEDKKNAIRSMASWEVSIRQLPEISWLEEGRSHVEGQLATQRAQLGKRDNELWQTEEAMVTTPPAGGYVNNLTRRIALTTASLCAGRSPTGPPVPRLPLF